MFMGKCSIHVVTFVPNFIQTSSVTTLCIGIPMMWSMVLKHTASLSLPRKTLEEIIKFYWKILLFIEQNNPKQWLLMQLLSVAMCLYLTCTMYVQVQ